MIITVHRSNSINLKLFLETLGFESYFMKTGEYDDLLVIPDSRIELLKKVKQYVEHFKFIPYHYALEVGDDGDTVTAEKISFMGACVQTVEFNAVSGRFTLLLFRGEGMNVLWKTYGEVNLPSLPPTFSKPSLGGSFSTPTFERKLQLSISGRMKAVIKSKEENVINLISHCRVK